MWGILMSVFRKSILLAVFVACAACSPGPEEAVSTADIIFVGENIITMDDSNVEAVAVIGDRIAATGAAAEVLALRTDTTRLVELGEHALLPGFIDAHGHLSGVAQSVALVNLSSPPVGPIENIDDVVELLRKHIEDEQIEPGEWIFGYGYDDSLIAEKRHPDRDDLDRVSLDHPIALQHVSAHLSTGNTAALAAGNVTASTEDPAGGVIRRRAGTNEPNGVMEETAMRFYPLRLSGSGDEARQRELLRAAINIYASYGVTTIQDGGASSSTIEQMRSEAGRAPFAADVVAFLGVNALGDAEFAAVRHEPEYNGGFRVGGVKFVLDGSPQGRTAWLSQPYTQGPPGQDDDYVAYPVYDEDAWNTRIVDLLDRQIPVLAHANGDAAIEMMINGVARAVDAGGYTDHRSVIIHAQLMREDQLDRVVSLGVIPSYYAAHPFFWGDWHRLSFGEERASFISPLRATIDRGIPLTIHNDSPVVPPDMMRLVWIAVNRTTRSGYVLGADQRVTVMEALHAVTLGAAYQYFEEDNKGSITPGKQADLVILAENPLHAAPDSLKDIAVIETIARGNTIYRRE